MSVITESLVRKDMHDTQHPLASIEAAWNAGASPWSPAGLAALYTEDALFFGGRPGHAVGRAAIHGYFASYDGVIAKASMQLVEQQIIELTAQCVLAQGYVQFSFELNGGRQTASRLRTTLLLVLDADGWKIRQHHFSPTPDAPPLGN